MLRRHLALLIAVLLAWAGASSLLLPSPKQRPKPQPQRVKLASVPGSKLGDAVTTRLGVLVTPSGVTRTPSTSMVGA